MNTGGVLFPIDILRANPAASFELTTDTWFLVAAIVTLWVYMAIAPRHSPAAA